MDTLVHGLATGIRPGDAALLPVAGELKDPVCGMTVTDQSPHHVEHAGHPYYFCSAKCQAKFTAEPARFVQAGPAAQPAAGAVVPDHADQP